MNVSHDAYLIDDSPDRFDVPRMTEWMRTTYWWGDELSEAILRRACEHSALVVGSYLEGEQVGALRVVSDKTRFAWIADVFVAPEHRGRGLARAMVRFVMNHPELAMVSRFMLVTRDAHAVYASLGFVSPARPESILELRRQAGQSVI